MHVLSTLQIRFMQPDEDGCYPGTSWMRVPDEEGRYYYWNEETEESTYCKPVAVGG